MGKLYETLPTTFRLTRWIYTKSVATGIVGAIIVAAMLGSTPNGQHNNIGIAAFLVLSGWIFFTWLRRQSVQLTIHQHRLTYRNGILSRINRNISISQIVGVNVVQTFSDRLIGAGTIVIETTGTEIVTCDNMGQARRIGNLLTHLKEAEQAR